MKWEKRNQRRSIFRRICLIFYLAIAVSLFASMMAILLMGGTASGQSYPPDLIGAEYIVSGATVTVGWDGVPAALDYEARLAMFDKKPITYFALARIPSSETEVTFHRPRAGHFRAEVRSCNDTLPSECVGDGVVVVIAVPGTENRCCSRWAQSTNKEDATVDGVAMAWWLFWQLPKLPPLP